MRSTAFQVVVTLAVLMMPIACRNSEGAVRGSTLREIVENEIRDHVRQSWGELRGQNFSDEDYDRFKRDDIPGQIVAQLRTNKVFHAALTKVRAMTPEERTSYLKRCRAPLRKTWAELGEISRAGTTEAGQKAELDIANAIVDLAQTMLADAAG
jgi:hypothetical protein